MKATAEFDRLLIAHMLDCIARIREFTTEGRLAFFASRLIQDAVLRNLQTMSESSQTLERQRQGVGAGHPVDEDLRHEEHPRASIPRRNRS